MTSVATAERTLADQRAGLYLVRRLRRFAELSATDIDVLLHAMGPARSYASRQDLICEGEEVDCAHVLVSGFACRHRTLPDGRRQILGYSLPGDLCDVRSLDSSKAYHGVSTMGAAEIATLSPASLGNLFVSNPSLARAFWRSALIDESITREWLFNIGQRTALERIAHLFCEIFARLSAMGLVGANRCDFPVTQAELADTVALSTVHVNRTLQELRRSGVLSVSSKTLVIHDLSRLQHLAMFDPAYLK